MKNEYFTRLTVPNGTVEILDGEYAFREEIVEVCLPESIRKIGRFAFLECVNLKKINLPKNLTEIGEGAFCNCLSLPTPNPCNAISVGAYAFHHTKGGKP